MFDFLRSFVAVLLLALGLAGIPVVAAADAVTDGLAGLADRSFSRKVEAVAQLGASGDQRAETILNALLDGRLYVRNADSAVVIGEERGKAFLVADPTAGAEAAEAAIADFTKITVNNRMRGAIRGALGALTLFSADAGTRAAAADAVFKTPTADMLPLLDKALARETDNGVKRRMERAWAAVAAVGAGETAERLAAIETLGSFADPDVRSLLGGLAVGNGEVAQAAGLTLRRIDESLVLWGAVGNVFQGVSLGSVLLLAAVGLAITFGVMGVINMAHGELVMLGAYTTFVVQEAFRAHLPGAFDMSLFVAVPAAFLVSGLVGIALERGVIRFLYGRPLETLLATWGISLILQQLVRSVFGPTNREVGSPSWMSGAYETASGLVLTYNRIAIIVFSLMVIGVIALILRKTSLGLSMRAVTQNRRMAGAMGIRTGRVDALTFGLGSGIAGVAGVALSQIDNVSPNLGQSYIIDSFMVVVFGGVGNLWGTLVGAFSLGIVNKFLEPYAGAVLGKIFVLIAIILFIQKRPRGLFAPKGRAVEA
ncbi:MAG: urea ABC transporter permease subunit UrtB [Rhodospirillales bacterium]|nr:urea ABC transporter permease subunit UrtB [Rhodospirillales bacterium]